jgi:branched-chain amino acid transport system substrate-binding protein
MITRRNLLKTSSAAGLTLAAGGLAAPAIAQGARIRLGYVSPQSGPLAAFSEADSFILNAFANSEVGANFEVIVKDSQSNPNRAAEVARELIIDDEIDIMLVGNTPETTNPVSTICEIEEIPCISSLAPWQPWFIGRQGNPGDPGDVGAVRLHLPLLLGSGGRHRRLHQHVEPARHQPQRRRFVPQRRRRQRMGRSERRLPAAAGRDELQPHRSGPVREPAPTISRAQINAFRAAECEIITGVVRCRPTSRPSGRRPSSRASAPRWRPSARRSCSRRRSRLWATPATTSVPRSGGHRRTRSAPR